MKNIILILLTIYSVNLFAVDPLNFGRTNKEITLFDFIPNVGERNADEANFLALQGWERINIIVNGKIVNIKYWNLIKSFKINENRKNPIYIQDLYELSIRLPHIKYQEISLYSIDSNRLYSADSNGIITLVVPMVMGLRFQEKSGEKGMSEIFSGTNETSMILTLRDSKIVDVEFKRFSGSHIREKIGHLVGTITKYDDAFTKNILEPVLLNYFSDNKVLENLISTVRRGIEIRNTPENKDEVDDNDSGFEHEEYNFTNYP